MNKNTLSTPLIPTLAMLTLCVNASIAQIDTNAISETTDGLTFTDGVFYPSYSIQGMTYNTETKSYQPPAPTTSGSSGGGSGGGSGLTLEQQQALYADYTNSGDQASFLSSKTPAELAGLFQYMGTNGAGATEQNTMLSQMGWRQGLPFLGGKVSLLPRVVAPFFFGMSAEQAAADTTNFNNFLKSLPSSEVRSILANAGYGHDRVNYSGVNLSAGLPEATQATNSSGTPYVQSSTGLGLEGLNFQGAVGLTATAIANSGGWEGSKWISSAPVDLRGTGITREALTTALNALPLVSNGRSPEGDYLQSATDPTFSRYALEWPVPADVGGGTKIMVIFDGDAIYPNNVRPD